MSLIKIGQPSQEYKNNLIGSELTGMTRVQLMHQVIPENYQHYLNYWHHINALSIASAINLSMNALSTASPLTKWPLVSIIKFIPC